MSLVKINDLVLCPEEISHFFTFTYDESQPSDPFGLLNKGGKEGHHCQITFKNGVSIFVSSTVDEVWKALNE